MLETAGAIRERDSPSARIERDSQEESMAMEPLWLTTLANVLILFFLLAIPLGLIGLGISLGWRLLRGETPNDMRRAYGKSGRLLLAVVAIVVGFLWLVLSFITPVRPGQSPFLAILPVLLIIFVQISFWVLIIVGAIWLVLWLARRMGVVGPARESPLDILKARYARGELSKAQFEELKRDLADP
jgi:putative membrane protein